jgi:hypothetical protein
MAGSWRVVLGIAVFLSLHASAHAFGECMGYAPSYYYWGPTYYYYAPSPRVIPVPDAKAKSTSEPPLRKLDKTAGDRAPVIITAHALAANKSSKERVKIGFWNLTGRDITITIEGKTRALVKNRSVTLELDREFSWRVDGRPDHVERVPDGMVVYEVLVRD